MSFLAKFNYLFRKYPLLRLALLLVSVLIIFIAFVYLFTLEENEPLIIDIHPSVGEAGDVMTITGQHFGKKTAGSSVIIGGIRITTSSYLEWTDDTIKIVLPFNIADGLVYVENRKGVSSPSVFANKKSVPVPVIHDVNASLPVINSVDVLYNTIGGLVTIEGANFGTFRENSKVLFAKYDSNAVNKKSLIECSTFDKDYQFWSDNKIKVRIPEGAISGNIYIKTNEGTSDSHSINLFVNVGSKSTGNKRTYVIDVNADITDFQAEEHASLNLFIPKPVESFYQTGIQFLSSSSIPESSFYNTYVQRLSSEDVITNKNVFEHSFSVDVYSTETTVKESAVRKYSDEVLVYYNDYLKSDIIVPSDDESIVECSAKIVGKTKNPYTKAKLIYNWVLENIKIEDTLHAADDSVVDVLKSKKADAYEITMLYSALLRACGIPTVPNAGILLDSKLVSSNHWWTEFYIEGIGWIPVDIALAAGLQYDSFHPIVDKEEYYFGNLEGQHICFSRGLNRLGQTPFTGKKVYRPKTYALQTIWEESTEEVKKYSSYWQNASVLGVY